MTRRHQDFQTIRSEGGLLPADLLRRVLDRSANLAGTRLEDYGLTAGERLNEGITQSWNRLRKHWAEFRTLAVKLPEGEAGTGLTNDRWNLPLLRELGFGLLPASAGPEIEGRTYAISRCFGPVPVHLIGCGLSLDRRAAGQRGAAAANPHGLVQEFLNRSDAHLWALLSNGLRLRVLRDNQALSRQSFLEFDLEAMFGGEVYSDFVLLWLVAHASRFAPREGDRPESCWLEQWTKLAVEQGARALGELRGGVERALEILGEGFTSHTRNIALREALRSGSLPLTDFHGQLLRVIYRLIFLFVAEDRTLDGLSLLHPRDDSDAARTARDRYAAYYGTARLRELAGKIKGSRHGDLWEQINLICGALSGMQHFAAVREQLALPALGSFLWDPQSTAALNASSLVPDSPTSCALTNHDLLEALRHLAFTRQGKVLRPVDYRNLGAEELGGVYESLLALTPQVSSDGARFTFAEFAGNERKTSGSYYTPDSLVQCLLDSALDPVVDAAIKGKTPAEAEQTILALKICDPAVGSGHFLVGAAHRLARHLARVRALAQGESEPSPLLYQHALRDVIGRCLYGVDLNPMAAELCRVSLWLEALEPGKPLSFLDHHIRVGNSLLGATPELIAAGLPDDAFKPIEGDDKTFCTALKRRNRQEREGQQDMLHLMVAEPSAEYNSIEARSRSINEAPDDNIAEIQRKADQYHRLVVSPEYHHRQQVADAWCAAFVWPKSTAVPEPLTTDTIHRLETDAEVLAPAQQRELEKLAGQYRFFHWHLAFPEVFVAGGFDCVLGNPPWDKIQPEEEKYFSATKPDIATAESAKVRKELIAGLKNTDFKTHSLWSSYKRDVESFCHFLKSSGVYPLSSEGNLNSYRIFSELSVHLTSANGRAGLVLQTALATGESGKELFDHLLATRRLVQFLDFENRQEFFQAVHPQFRFCLITIRGIAVPSDDGSALFGWLLHNLSDLAIPRRLVRLSSTDLKLFNPTSKTCPIFTSQDDFNVSRVIYRNSQHIFLSETQRYGAISLLGELFNLTRDSRFFLPRDANVSGGILPLLEAKYVHQFDHRFGTVAFDGVIDSTDAQKRLSSFTITTAKVVDTSEVTRRLGERSVRTRWLAGFRRISSGTNERTAIMAIFPVGAIGNTIVLALGLSADEAGSLVANVNAFAFDFCCRQKVSGTDINVWIFKQLPVIPLAHYAQGCTWSGGTKTILHWVLTRVLELTYTAWDLEPFAKDCGWDGPPFRWNEERRFLIRCELDAAFFHLYLPADEAGDWRPAGQADGCPHDETPEQFEELKRHFPTPRDAVAYIMDTFPIVRRKDEQKYDGDFRTKRVILEIYDAMQEAIHTGKIYPSCVDPLPGPPVDAAGRMMSVYQLDRNNWPSHIHPSNPAWEESILHAWFGIRQQQRDHLNDQQVFPWDGREAFVYALIPYLVHKHPGKTFEFYRDAAVLASHAPRCESLLLQDTVRDSHRRAMHDADWLRFPDTHHLRPSKIRETLQAKGIVRTDAGSGATTLADESRLPPLPSGLKSLLPLILTAAENLERLQKGALDRAEATQIDVTWESLAKEMNALMVA